MYPQRREFDHPASPLYFKVDDIDASYADLQSRGVGFRGAPHLIAKMPFFRDGEGNTHALMCEKRAASAPES
jgi:hypothetical protein